MVVTFQTKKQALLAFSTQMREQNASDFRLLAILDIFDVLANALTDETVSPDHTWVFQLHATSVEITEQFANGINEYKLTASVRYLQEVASRIHAFGMRTDMHTKLEAREVVAVQRLRSAFLPQAAHLRGALVPVLNWNH